MHQTICIPMCPRRRVLPPHPYLRRRVTFAVTKVEHWGFSYSTFSQEERARIWWSADDSVSSDAHARKSPFPSSVSLLEIQQRQALARQSIQVVVKASRSRIVDNHGPVIEDSSIPPHELYCRHTAWARDLARATGLAAAQDANRDDDDDDSSADCTRVSCLMQLGRQQKLQVFETPDAILPSFMAPIMRIKQNR